MFDLLDAAEVFMADIEAACSKYRKAIKGGNVRRALLAAKKEGRIIGRPKKRDDKAIKTLREQGLSMHKIAKKLKCSTWTVFSSLKKTAAGGLESGAEGGS